MISIRAFNKNDAKASAEIITANQDDLGDIYDEISLVKSSAYTRYFVASKNDVIVGIVGLTDLQNGIGMVGSLSVHPNFYRQGIATKLLSHLQSEAKTLSFRKLLLLTHEQNKPTMLLAIKNDFVPEGQLREHFKDGKKAVVYFSYFLN